MDFIDLKTQQKLLREDIDAAIAKVLDHGKYILGPEVKECEKQLAEFVGVKHCITVSSGSDALLIALMALGIEAGDEVITVPYTWISTAEMIALIGAKPVFVDIDPQTFNMDPSKIEDAITDKTKAIMPVGIYGQCAEMDSINAIASKYELPVIEDGAQSFGATYKGNRSCGLSTIGCTSFFPAKPLGCYGDGGAVFTNDDTLAEKMKWIHVHGQEKPHCHPVLGLNGRFDSIQAAILLLKLSLFEKECEQRETIGNRYTAHLSDNKDVECPYIAEGNTSVYAQYTILAEDRDALSETLSDSKIPNVAYYKEPLHFQPVFRNLGYVKGDFPITENVASSCLSLPMSAYLSEADQDLVLEALR